MNTAERNILLRIQYDGTDFYGWQIQHHQRTVQGEIEKVLQRMHGRPVSLLTAGRTDSGVHAVGQAGNFRTDLHSVPAGKFASALNSMLPRDVRISASREVPYAFHATHDAVERWYRYRMYVSRFADPLLDRYRLRIPCQPDMPAMNRMASLLVGTRDFSSLASYKEHQVMTRTIYRSHCFPDRDGIVYEVAGRGFLWKMVRTIVGTMLDCLGDPQGADRFQRILEARDRSRGGKTAAPHGLVLYRVVYPPEALCSGTAAGKEEQK